jgi:UDP-glucose 4-epimerase
MARETVLVTGGAGYVGSHTVAELVAAGFETIVFDNLQQGHAAAVSGRARLVVGDLGDREAVRAVFRRTRIDAVLHFAANSLVGESMRSPFRYIGDNVVNTLNLVEAAVDAGVRRFVLSSTCAIFGDPDRVPIDEDVRVAPGSPYAESKYLIERILRWAADVHGLRYACLRYFNAAGAHPDIPIGEDHTPETHLVPIALEAALGLRPYLEIHGDDYPTPDGTCVRDYVHVCDLADAHIRVLPVLHERNCHYNVGTGNGASVRQVIDTVKDVTGRNFEVRVGPRRPGDSPVLVARPDRIRSELGWQPRHPHIHDIVETAWAWRQRHPQGYREIAAAGWDRLIGQPQRRPVIARPAAPSNG